MGPTPTQDLVELADGSHALKWQISSLARYQDHSCTHSLTARRRPRSYPTSNIPSTASRRRPLNCGTVPRCADSPASSTYAWFSFSQSHVVFYHSKRLQSRRHDIMYPYNVTIPASPYPSRAAIRHFSLTTVLRPPLPLDHLTIVWS